MVRSDSIRGMNADKDVLVIGGGIAGLTAGVGLAEKGCNVTVLEKDERLGGRASSWVDPETGDPVHIGPHIFMSEYPNMFKLMDKLGTRDRIVWQHDKFITLVEGQETQTIRQYGLPAPLQYAPGLFIEMDYSYMDVASNTLPMIYAMQMDEEDVMHLDQRNAYSFLKSMGVTESSIEQLWQFTCMAIMNVPLELCSAGSLMRFYKHFIGYNRYKIGFADDGLGEIYAPQSKQVIEGSGGEVRLGTEVDSLIVERDEVKGVKLSDGTTIEADHVISSLPPQALRRIVPRSWRKNRDPFDKLVHFEPCPYVSPYLWFDRKLTELPFWARSYSPNDLNCDFYDLSNVYDGWDDRNSVITSNVIYSRNRGTDRMSDEEIIEETLKEIAEFIPEAREANLEHYRVHRIPMAIHCPFPGTERRRPDNDPDVKGLTLAGDWIQTHTPSSMESAAKSGWMAAEAVLEEDNREVDLSVSLKDVEGLTGLVDQFARRFPPKKAYQWVRRNVNSLLGGTAA